MTFSCFSWPVKPICHHTHAPSLIHSLSIPLSILLVGKDGLTRAMDEVSRGADGLKWPFREQIAMLRKQSSGLFVIPVTFTCFPFAPWFIFTSPVSVWASIYLHICSPLEGNRCVYVCGCNRACLLFCSERFMRRYHRQVNGYTNINL